MQNSSTGENNDKRGKVKKKLEGWFLTRRDLKFQKKRTHYGPRQKCWISNQHQKHKSGRGSCNEQFWRYSFSLMLTITPPMRFIK
jgi:hypothetical protein